MSPLRGIVLVGVGLLGVVMIVGCLPRFRRPTLHQRLVPYLGALGPRRSLLLSAGAARSTGISAVLRPITDALAARLTRLLGDDGNDLTARLATSGSTLTPGGFRSEQVTWGLLGLGGAIALVLLLIGSGRDLAPLLALILATAGAALGVIARDRSLTKAIEARRARAQVEFPTVVDMVCLAVTAGESLRGALELVADAGDGPILSELRRVLRSTRAGVPIAHALVERAAVLGLPSFDRFVGSVLAAQDRGVPLAEPLRAMASDVREAEKREVIESAGKKQITMLVPVVALILPVAIVFAFYPGVVAIRTLAR